MTNIFNGESPRAVMTWRRLSRYMDALDSAGELRRVSEPVDCHLEAGTIADKLVKSKGPAILFEQPRLADGSISEFPLAMNLLEHTSELIVLWVSKNHQKSANEWLV